MRTDSHGDVSTMGLTLTVLASSSKANCALIRSSTTTVMVDCGLARALVIRALAVERAGLQLVITVPVDGQALTVESVA